MARSSSIGGIFAELTLRDKKFVAGMKVAGARLKAFGSAAVKYGAMAGSALAAGLAVGVKRTIDMGGELTDLSAQTGVAIDDLMRIQQAYKDNGKEASAAGKDINKMQKAIAAASKDEGSTSDPFAKIGLSAEKLMMMEPDEQFFKIGQAIKSIRNPTERAARAMDIFGKSGGSLLAVFDGSDLDSINRSLGKMPELMAEFAGEMDHAGDLLGRFPNKSDQFFAGFTAGVIGNIIPSLEMIDGFDFTNIGKNLGDALSGAIIKQNKFLATLFNSFTQMGVGETPIDAYRRFAAEQADLDNQDKAAVDERNRQREADAAYEKARMFEYANSPDYIDPASSIAKKASTISKPRSFTPEFDDYQRRGLSLSASPAKDMQGKQLTVLEKIARVLEKIEQKEPEATF